MIPFLLMLAAEDADPIVVTAHRVERPLSEIGESVTVIDQAEIERRQSDDVVQLLRTVPGVTITRNGGLGGFAGVNIRGAESDQTVALIDGVKLNDPSAPGGGFDFGRLLIGNIARIEVVRGSQSVIWGSQAIGGVVNMISRSATETPSANARAEYGSFDTAEGFANLAGTFGPVSASLGGGYYRSDGISAFDGGAERDGFRQYGANARLELAITDAIGIDLRGFYADSRNDFDGFAPPTFAFGDTREFANTEEVVGYAGLNAALWGGRFRNRLGFAYTLTDRANRDREPDGAPFATFDARGENERFEYQGTLTPNDHFEAVFGAESETSRYRTEGFGAVAREQVGLDSVYAQLTVKPFDGLSLTGGIRHDDHESFGGETTLAASGAFSPNGGATTLRASYGEGFKAPSLFQLFSDFGNQTLEPEQSRSFDAGVAQKLVGGAIELGATYFRRTTRNQIDFVSCFQDARPICDGRPFGTYDNIRRTRGQGVELALAMTPVEALTFRAAYSFIDAENRDTGTQLARRPRHSVNAQIDYRWGFGLETGATIVHVGDSFDDGANTRPLDGYVLVDLRASLPVGERIELFGRIENLFDSDYQTVSFYGTSGRSAYAGVRLRL